MRKEYTQAEVEFLMFGSDLVCQDTTAASECDFHCDGNCSCHFCVGVCTWDCTADDSTCTTGDFNE